MILDIFTILFEADTSKAKEGVDDTRKSTEEMTEEMIKADKQAGKRQPRAVLPGIQLKSPKITRNLTTAWFAKRVDDREQACVRKMATIR